LGKDASILLTQRTGSVERGAGILGNDKQGTVKLMENRRKRNGKQGTVDETIPA